MPVGFENVEKSLQQPENHYVLNNTLIALVQIIKGADLDNEAYNIFVCQHPEQYALNEWKYLAQLLKISIAFLK